MYTCIICGYMYNRDFVCNIPYFLAYACVFMFTYMYTSHVLCAYFVMKNFVPTTCNKDCCEYISKLAKPQPPMCTGYYDNLLKIPILFKKEDKAVSKKKKKKL